MLDGMRRVVLVLALLGGCHSVDDVALEVREATDITGAERGLADARSTLMCSSIVPPPHLAALCVEVYVLAGGRTTAQTTCHDANVTLGAGEADLTGYLRGLGTLAGGIAETDQNHVRIVGYSEAGRASASLTMCGITPSFPGSQLSTSSKPFSLPLYLLCKPAATESIGNLVFQDYCGSSGFVSLFP
jgi:hypothetical protein